MLPSSRNYITFQQRHSYNPRCVENLSNILQCPVRKISTEKNLERLVYFHSPESQSKQTNNGIFSPQSIPTRQQHYQFNNKLTNKFYKIDRGYQNNQNSQGNQYVKKINYNKGSIQQSRNENFIQNNCNNRLKRNLSTEIDPSILSWENQPNLQIQVIKKQLENSGSHTKIWLNKSRSLNIDLPCSGQMTVDEFRQILKKNIQEKIKKILAICTKISHNNRISLSNLLYGARTQRNTFSFKKPNFLSEIEEFYYNISNRIAEGELIGFRSYNSCDKKLDYILSLSDNKLKIQELLDYCLKSNLSSQKRIIDLELVWRENLYKSTDTLTSYQFIKYIASGGFSRVYLVRDKQTNSYFAMKLILKQNIFLQTQSCEALIQNQKSILEKLSSNAKKSKSVFSDFGNKFVTKMKSFFTSKYFYVFVMEYYPGGQLFNRLKNIKRMSQEDAKFYFIQILLALDYVHGFNVIYRDIKPENIMIDKNGNVRLADFGLAKFIGNQDQNLSMNSFENQKKIPKLLTRNNYAYSFCGSPQYMSPQMLLQIGHSFTLDYYCLGALFYELIYGCPPFYSLNKQQIYQGVLNQQPIFYQQIVTSTTFRQFISLLLIKNPRQRLGSKGFRQIIEHPYIKQSLNMHINQVQANIRPPYIPNLFQLDWNIQQNETDSKDRRQHYNKLLQQQFIQDKRRRIITLQQCSKQNCKLFLKKDRNLDIKLSPSPNGKKVSILKVLSARSRNAQRKQTILEHFGKK